MSFFSKILSYPAFIFFQITGLIHSIRRPLLLVSALYILTNPHVMSFFSKILSYPAFIFFHITWLIHSIRRPLLLVSALCILTTIMSFFPNILSYPAVIFFQITWLIPSLRRPLLLVSALCILTTIMSFYSKILSYPAFIFFQITWLIHSIRRPLILVSALCILTNPHAAIRKLKLFQVSFLYLALCKDKKWKVPSTDPASFFPKELGGTAPSNRKWKVPSTVPASFFPKELGGTAPSNSSSHEYREKTLILIRHGESTWNDTFNAGDRSKLLFVAFFVPNLLYAILMEVYYFVSGKDSDSWFFDSPLSAKGVGQGEGLRRFLKKERMRLATTPTTRKEEAVRKAVGLLLAAGEESNPTSQVVSSNLRRAISTAAIGLADRFAATSAESDDDGILLLPSLQEISRNPDALTILPPKGKSRPTWCDDDIDGLSPGTFAELIDSRHHDGNKSLDSNGLIRLRQFCADVFDPSKIRKDVVVAAGHSLFYRSLFQVYLPRGSGHISKEKKLVNGGTVMVTLREASINDGSGRRKEYMIDPKSLVVVYGGFEKYTMGLIHFDSIFKTPTVHYIQ